MVHIHLFFVAERLTKNMEDF
jgi:hypothetical protein